MSPTKSPKPLTPPEGIILDVEGLTDTLSGGIMAGIRATARLAGILLLHKLISPQEYDYVFEPVNAYSAECAAKLEATKEAVRAVAEAARKT